MFDLYNMLPCVAFILTNLQEIDPDLVDQDKIINEDLGDDDSKLISNTCMLHRVCIHLVLCSQ